MNKILEKVIEPVKIETGSIFKIKIKTRKYITYGEMKKKTVDQIKEYTVGELKGE